MINTNNAAHWAKTKLLMVKTLTIWFVFSFLIHFFVHDLNGIIFIGFPFGFYMGAQGSLIIFVISIFVFAKKQNEIDKEFGVNED